MNLHLTTETVEPGYCRADFTDRLPVARRLNIRGYRHYYQLDAKKKSVVIVPSVTTIIDKTLPMPDHVVKWYCDLGYHEAKREMNRRAHYGTALHILVSKLLTEKTIDLEQVGEHAAAYIAEHSLPFDTRWWEYEMKKDLLSIANWAAEKDVTPIAIEVPMVSAEMGYAGTADIICELTFNRKRVIALVDLKSGRNGFTTKHEAQLAAYRQLWNFLVPEVPVEMIFNLAPKDWRKDPTYTFTNQGESEGANMWPSMLAMHRATDEKDRTTIEIGGTVHLGRDVSDCYQVVNLEEKLAELHRIDVAADADAKIKEVANVDDF